MTTSFFASGNKDSVNIDAKNGKNFYASDMQSLLASKALKMPDEHNPIIAHTFSADPAVLVFNDCVYVYATNDMQQFEYSKGSESNKYNKITSLTVSSSKDLVNWTFEGVIDVAGKNGGKGPALWANNSWAPAIAHKVIDGKDMFFLYFADSGNGIGVLQSTSPTGPFIDPLSKPLISRATPTCASVNWLFDPAVLVDDDGKGYLYFGGGHDDDKFEHPKTARVVALKDNMIEIDGTPQVIDAPFLFEDSGINKIGKTYYYTYCTNWVDRSKTKDKDVMPIAVIAYMTSNSPLGPFVYQGYTLENPATYFGVSGNNHHWIFNFKNAWYIAYHSQTEEKKLNLLEGGYRSLFIDNFTINDDGSFPIQKGTKTGVKQVLPFNCKQKVLASTCARSVNVAFFNDASISAIKDGAYICIEGVDLSFNAKNLLINVAQVDVKDGNASLSLKLDNFASGKTIASAKISQNGTLSIPLENFTQDKTLHDLYFVLTGSFRLLSWQIE